MDPDQIKIRGYRSYKKLSLAQRIQVIKAHKYLQNYQKLARLFNCSTMQIKCIIARQDELLERYESFRTQNINNSTDANSHEEKMNLLGKVVFEYLLRAMNSRMPTDAMVIRQKALEVKEVLGIEDFTPDEEWLHAFKLNSNRVDLMDLMEKLENDIENRRSLDCNDIIEYIREQVREERRKLIAEDERISRLSTTFEKLSKHRVQANSEESFTNENRNNVENTSATVSKQKTVVGEKDIRKTRAELKAANNKSVKVCSDNNVYTREQDRVERPEIKADDEGMARLHPTFEKPSIERVQAKKEKSFGNEDRSNDRNTPVTVSKRKKVVDEKDIRKTRMKLKAAARRCVQDDTEVNINYDEDIEVKEEEESSDGKQVITPADSKIFKIIKVESIITTANCSTSPEKLTRMTTPRAGISSYTEALRYLRKLENFVMNQEDYEALSVITHLEYILRNSK